MVVNIIQKFDRKKVYVRYPLHALLWVLMYLFFIYLKKPLLGLSSFESALVVIKDVIVIAAIFYFISYFVIPKLLQKKKFFLFVVSLVVIYYFYAITVYLDFSIMPKLIDIPGKGYQSYAKRILSSGFSGILRLQHAAEILMDLSYLLSLALIIKLFIKLFDMTTESIKLQLDNLNLELAFLKSQINAHFLFNTLNNVYSLALHKSDKTADVVLKLSDLLRYTLYDSNTQQISLGEEIKFVRNYIDLERIRHSSKVTISFDVSGEHEGLFIAPLIIFTFIENAFKHGLNASTASSWVIIKLMVEGDVLNVFISNSKFVVNRPSSYVGGIGIVNTKKRLNLLYKNNYSLNINERGDTFSVNLTLKLANRSN